MVESVKYFGEDTTENINGKSIPCTCKHFTGTLLDTSTVSVPHGIGNFENILSVACAIKDNGVFRVLDNCDVIVPAYTFTLAYDNINIKIENIGTGFRNKKYRLKVNYAKNDI